MKTHIPKLSAVLALLAIASAAHSATITWTNTSGGNWSVTNNWSPQQIPTNTDTVLITAPGTYTVNFDIPSISGGNYVYFPSIVSNLTVGVGTGGAGVQTLLITNLSPVSYFQVNNLLLLTNGGVVTMTNGNLWANPLTIDKRGVFNGSSENIAANVMVANGGLLNSVYGHITENSSVGFFSNQTLTLTNGGTLDSFDDTIGGTLMIANGGIASAQGVMADLGFTVEHGGTLNLGASSDFANYGASFIVAEPSTNYGTINMTDGILEAPNGNVIGGVFAHGSFFNGSGGLFNLSGNGGIYVQSSFINQGAVVQSSGSNSVVGGPFDTSGGTVSNLSGVFTLGYESNWLAGTYYAAPSATIQLQGVDVANDNSTAQLALGTPLVLAGNGQYQLTSGYLYLPANVPPNLELVGDTLQLGPGFQGGTITNLTLDGIRLLNALPITGSLAATNSAISINLTVANGGVLSASGSVFLSGAITIAHAGTMNVEGPVILISSLTNAGTLNLTSPITFGGTFGGGTYEGVNNGIVNQAGGLINLGNNAGIIIPYPFSPTTNFFVNQGAIVQNAGIGATNTINVAASVFDFDNSQGAITNLSGTLILTFLQGPLIGTFYAAAGATIQLGGGTAATPLQPGVLGGSGQLQFISGYLYAPANVPPKLSLQGGLLELGPGFQGGAITNLTLDGMELTNQLSTTLPIKGKFTVLNSGGYVPGYYGPVLSNTGVYGNYVVVNGGSLSLSNAAMYGAVTVSSGGVLNAGSGSILYGNVAVAGGGVVNSSGATYRAVTVSSGGLFDSLDTISPYFAGFGPSSSISGPMTNSGTINLTNSAIVFYNDGTTNYQGCLINQAGGLIDFWGNTAIDGSGGYAYLVNQGQITKSGGSSFSGFDFNLATNSGTITAQTGPMVLGNQWISLPGGSLNVVLNSATNYGSVIISSNGPFTIAGNADLVGAFNATLNNGYVPTNGTTFNVITYGSFTGSFSSLGLPAAVTWQSNYGSTNFSLVAGSELPQFGIVNLLGTNLIFNGIGGSPGSNYVMLASTNLALPLANWSALATNIFDGSGQFHYTNPVSPAKPRQFFIFKLP